MSEKVIRRVETPLGNGLADRRIPARPEIPEPQAGRELEGTPGMPRRPGLDSDLPVIGI